MLGLSKQPCLRLHPLPSEETFSLFEYLSCLDVLICLHAIEYCIESRTLEYRNLCLPDQCLYFVIVPDKYYNVFHPCPNLFQGKPVFQYSSYLNQNGFLKYVLICSMTQQPENSK